MPEGFWSVNKVICNNLWRENPKVALTQKRIELERWVQVWRRLPSIALVYTYLFFWAIWADGILLCMKMGSKTKVHSSESANSSALSFIMWYCALFCQYSIYGTDPIFFGENPPLPLPLTLVLIHSWSAAASGTPAPGLLPPLSAPAPPPLLLSVIFHFHCCYNHTPAPLLLLAHSHYCSSNSIALSLPLIVLEGLSPGQGLTIPRAGQHMKGLETWKSSQKIHFWCGGFHAWA